MKNINIFGNFIFKVSDPTKTLIGLDEFVEDHVDAVFWYGHIGIPDDEICKVVLEHEPSFMDKADFFSQAIEVFERLKEPESISRLIQEHKESIGYFREKIAPYL